MSARRIALATSSSFPQMAPDDQLLEAWLRQQGHEVAVQVWDEATDWERFDLVIVRSCWDYHRKRGQFLEWIQALRDASVNLLNPPAMLAWNHDKRYLQDLAERSIPIVETEWVEGGSSADLMEILKRRGWSQAVIKPRVSATAWKTSRTSLETARQDQAGLDTLLSEENVMVQGFVDEIVEVGEFSFLYFNGVRSHAVLKRASAGDFRVQDEFAGTAHLVQPQAAVWSQADAVLATLDEVPLYARVDGPLIDGTLHVLELELIEPALFLAVDPGAAARFGAAALGRL